MSAEKFNEFVDMDIDEPVTGELDDNEIIENVKKKKKSKLESEEQEAEEEDEDEDKQPELKMPTSAVLIESINNVIQTHVSTKKSQKQITQFFKIE